MSHNPLLTINNSYVWHSAEAEDRKIDHFVIPRLMKGNQASTSKRGYSRASNDRYLLNVFLKLINNSWVNWPTRMSDLVSWMSLETQWSPGFASQPFENWFSSHVMECVLNLHIQLSIFGYLSRWRGVVLSSSSSSSSGFGIVFLSFCLSSWVRLVISVQPFLLHSQHLAC
jgi:hypothetical protein